MIVLGGVLHALEDRSASLGPDARWEACRGPFSGEMRSYNEIELSQALLQKPEDT